MAYVLLCFRGYTLVHVPKSCAVLLVAAWVGRQWLILRACLRLCVHLCGRMMEQVATFASDVDHWFTQNYAGHDWAQSGLQGTLPWKQLPLSSVWSPIIGVTAYLLGA